LSLTNQKKEYGDGYVGLRIENGKERRHIKRRISIVLMEMRQGISSL